VDVVKVMEQRVLPHLHRCAEVLRSEFPAFAITVHSGSVGSLTSYQGHGMYIDCLLPDVPLDRPDDVALYIGLMHITTVPKIHVSVAWGHPSGYVEAEHIEINHPAILTDQVIADLIDALPALCSMLRDALQRGQPPADPMATLSGR